MWKKISFHPDESYKDLILKCLLIDTAEDPKKWTPSVKCRTVDLSVNSILFQKWVTHDLKLFMVTHGFLTTLFLLIDSCFMSSSCYMYLWVREFFKVTAPSVAKLVLQKTSHKILLSCCQWSSMYTLYFQKVLKKLLFPYYAI